MIRCKTWKESLCDSHHILTQRFLLSELNAEPLTKALGLNIDTRACID